MNPLVSVAAWLLDARERDAVLGDLAESSDTTRQALGGIFGLAARRQAAEWTHWRPWLALITVAFPLGVLLCLLARRTADSSAIFLWLYGSNWSGEALRHGVARRDAMDSLAQIALQFLRLACWAWSAGLVLARVSRASLPINGLIFTALAFGGSLLGAPPRHFGQALYFSARAFRPNAAVFTGVFYGAVFPHLAQAVLVAVPAACGMWAARHGARGWWWVAACTALAVLLPQAGLAPAPHASLLQWAAYSPMICWLAQTRSFLPRNV